MKNLEILISNGHDTNRYRDLANDAMHRLQQTLQFEMRLAVTILWWDYRASPPTVVPRGALAAASLATVDRSNAVVAIFGSRVPNVTTQEIHRAFQRRRDGQPIDVFVFVNETRMSDEHRTFFTEIRDAYGEEIIYQAYANPIEFQAQLYTLLFKYLFEQLATANPDLLSGAAA
jgi:hypothetical protein